MKDCMKSWKEFCPDYQIIEWNESNVDLNDSFTIYPREYFCPYDIRLEKMNKTPNTVSIHYYSASWYTEEQKIEHKKLVKKRRMEKRLGKTLYKIWLFFYNLFCDGGLKDFLKSKKD